MWNRLLRHLLLCLALLCLVPLAPPPVAAQEELLPALRPAGEAAAPAPVIDTEADPGRDQAIAGRLRTLYASIEGLAPVQVQVTAGVVALSGEVSAQAAKEKAVRLARAVRGVVEVDNRIVVAQDLQGRLTPAVRRLRDAGNDFVRFLPVLLVGLAIIVAAAVIGRWLSGWRWLYRRVTANEFIAGLLATVVQGATLLAGVALTLLLLDATGIVNTLLGAAGILGLAFGFALRDTVENFIASTLLSLRRPFNPKDYVRIEEHEGIVVRLTSRATVLLTLDGNQVRIPNATVFKGLIVNFTAQPQRRFVFPLGIAPEEDLARAQRVALEALAGIDGVLADPPPSALYESIGESAVNLNVAAWMDQSTHDFLRVRSEAIRVVLTRMAEAGVDLPEPTVRMRRAPPVKGAGKAAETGVPAPAVATHRDMALDRVVEEERSRRPDLLERSGGQE